MSDEIVVVKSAEEKLAIEIMEIKPQDVTPDLAKEYMRIDFDDVDNDKMISMMTAAGKSFVQTYLRWKFTDREADLEITIALLAIIEHWYKNRGVLTEDVTKEELPFVFSGILDVHRDWAPGGGVI